MYYDDVGNSTGAVADIAAFSRRIHNRVKQDVGFEAGFTGMAAVAGRCVGLSETIDEDAFVQTGTVDRDVSGQDSGWQRQVVGRVRAMALYTVGLVARVSDYRGIDSGDNSGNSSVRTHVNGMDKVLELQRVLAACQVDVVAEDAVLGVLPGSAMDR